MKVVTYTCYMNHHQASVARRLYEKLGLDYRFIVYTPFNKDRDKVGFEDLNYKYPFIIREYENEISRSLAKEAIRNCDFFIHDCSNYELEKYALDNGAISLRCLEHYFKDNNYSLINVLRYLKSHTKHRYKNMYLLCASAYTAKEAKMFWAYPNKRYKWGYFIENSNYSWEELRKLKNSDKVHLMWAGRFLEWKHPDLCIDIAKILDKSGIAFQLDLYGEGKYKEIVLERAKGIAGLPIYFHEGVSNEKIKEIMAKSDIFLMLSDHGEGWGVVVNEAMAHGCTVVADKRVGSVPYLLEDGVSGVSYRGKRELLNKIVDLCTDKKKTLELGHNAYDRMRGLWSADTAADNLIQLMRGLQEGNETIIDDGPCSRA